ncbi:hypothetical protein B0T19DRAFT_405031 [Cercophora scortea]|uniref:Uncharacterized protein n=1 Tax=Cercophora scortea TaxID=314031 RepID=A0AAE0M3H0_9PEZI|nr:hypothetical protein B0T19DRAFT_405031 [Cercophora scortea]
MLDIDIRDTNNTTPLHLAASPSLAALDAISETAVLDPSDFKRYAQMFAEHRANRQTSPQGDGDYSTLEDGQGLLARFNTAWGKRDLEMIRLLLDCGMRGDRGDTLEILLLKVLSKELVQLPLFLLEKGASATATDGEGNTAYHYAHLGMNKKVIDRLVALGADPDALNDNGQNAVEWARGGNRASSKRRRQFLRMY